MKTTLTILTLVTALSLPGSSQEEAPPEGPKIPSLQKRTQFYFVARNDTYERIANKMGVDVNTLQLLNQNAELKIGNLLRLTPEVQEQTLAFHIDDKQSRGQKGDQERAERDKSREETREQGNRERAEQERRQGQRERAEQNHREGNRERAEQERRQGQRERAEQNHREGNRERAEQNHREGNRERAEQNHREGNRERAERERRQGERERAERERNGGPDAELRQFLHRMNQRLSEIESRLRRLEERNRR